MGRRTFIILLMCGFSAALGVGVISPFLPALAEEHGTNGFWLGMMFAGFGIARGIIMPIVGRISDRRGRKIFVVCGLLLYTLISLLYPLGKTVLKLTVIRMFHGLAAGMIIPIVLAYVGDMAEDEKVGLRTGTLNMMFYLGLATGPLLGGFLYKFFGFGSVFHVIAVLGALTFIIVLLFLPEDAAAENREPSKAVSFNSLIKYNFIKGILIIAVVCTLMMAVFLSFLPSLASEINVDTHHIGIILFVGILLAGVLQIPTGRLADRLDRNGKLIQIGIGSSLTMLALLVIPLCPDFKALLVTGCFMGVGAAISAPALLNISVGIGRRAGMGTWMGFLTAAMSVGLVITPLVSGIVMDHLGIDAVFYVLAVIAFFGWWGAFYYIHRRLLGYQKG